MSHRSRELQPEQLAQPFRTDKLVDVRFVSGKCVDELERLPESEGGRQTKHPNTRKARPDEGAGTCSKRHA